MTAVGISKQSEKKSFGIQHPKFVNSRLGFIEEKPCFVFCFFFVFFFVLFFLFLFFFLFFFIFAMIEPLCVPNLNSFVLRITSRPRMKFVDSKNMF